MRGGDVHDYVFITSHFVCTVCYICWCAFVLYACMGYLFIAYVMALFTLAGIFVVVYFPFPIQQEEIALNIEYELGQTNNFVPLRSIFGYIKDFFSGYQSVFLFQCIGNMLLFVPYGFFTGNRNIKRKRFLSYVFLPAYQLKFCREYLTLP